MLSQYDDSDGLPFVPPFDPPMPPQERVAAAESIRARGNALFKEGKTEGGLVAYEKALRYLDQHPASGAPPALTCRVAALSNAAMCRLKLDDPRRAIELCDRVLKIEGHGKNAKALFRKGCAHRALGDYEKAVEALEEARVAAPDDAGVKAELLRAEKDLKKFRFGW
jgi:tetratricopeptide (TPR) repeat protein